METPQILKAQPSQNTDPMSTPENRQEELIHVTEIPSKAQSLKQVQADQDPIFKDELRIELASQLTPQQLFTLCQDQTNNPIENLLSEHLEETKNQLWEIELLSKLNISSLPKRVTQWLNKQIQIYLKKHYDPQTSQLSHLRLRNRGVLLGHILYSIFELKCLDDVSGIQIDSLMISLSENQAVKVSIEIASELENAIYLIVKNKHEGVEDKSMYEQLFQQMIERIEKMGSENIRKQFVQPTMYYPRIDEIDGTFQLKNLNIHSTIQNLISQHQYQQIQTNELTQNLFPPQQLLKTYSKQIGTKLHQSEQPQAQLQQLCSEPTSCDQSSEKHSREADFYLQREIKFTQSVIYEADQDIQQKLNQPEHQHQLAQTQAIGNILVQNDQLNRRLPDDNFEQANEADSPQLQAQHTTMDTSHPSQLMLEAGQNQRIQQMIYVLQYQQESSQNGEVTLNIQNEKSEEKQVETQQKN